MKEEAEKKLQRYIRQLDHFERARRDEEAPLLEAAHKKQVRQAQMGSFHECAHVQGIKQLDFSQLNVPILAELDAYRL